MSIPSKKLHDENTLSEYNIQKESIIYLDTSGKMLIFVKTLEDKTLPFVVEDSDTIESLKSRIEDIAG